MNEIASWERFCNELNSDFVPNKLMQEYSDLFVPNDLVPDSGCELLRGYRSHELKLRTLKIVVRLLRKNMTSNLQMQSTVLRCMTIDCFNNVQNPWQVGWKSNPQFKKDLEVLLAKYNQLHFYNDVWSVITESSQPSKCSAAWNKLPSGLQAVVTQVVLEQGLQYAQPGVASLIDTIAEMHSPTYGLATEDATSISAWRPGHTWVLVAIKAEQSLTPPGLLMRLRIERLENGCGAIYPHPIKAAHLNFSQPWSAAIRNAWAVVKSSEERIEDYDYRWWLTVVEPSELVQTIGGGDALASPLAKWLAAGPLDGESATLAFALALKSVIKGEFLRKDRASTSSFLYPDSEDSAYGWESLKNQSNPVLCPVGSLSNKDQIIRICRQPGVEVEKLVVARDQPLVFPSEVTLQPLNTFNEAYTEFSEMERILEDYAKWVAGRWDRIVKAGRPKKGEQSS
jgi:hypothetical protein